MMAENLVSLSCRPGTTTCCRYLCTDANGWICAKLTSLKRVIDDRVRVGTMRATGDNCPGIHNEKATP